MTELKIFQNDELGSVRTLLLNDEVMFVGKDVADILGYSNTRKALLDHVDRDDKTYGVTIRDSIGRDQNPILINESGLYSLIFASKKPSAKKFKKWVTSEVLPSIRKTGMYATDYLLDNPEVAIAAFVALKEERDRNKILTKTIAIQNQQLNEMRPKASYYDVILNSTNVISMRELAKDYGKSAQWMNNKLHELGVQFKQGDTWLLYQKYSTLGYTNTKTHSYSRTDGSKGAKIHTYWTQKGRLFIYDLLKNENIIPLMEQEE